MEPTLGDFTERTRSENLTLASEVITISIELAAHFCSHFYSGPKNKEVSPEIELVRTVEFNILLPAIAVLGLVGNTINLFVLRSFNGPTFFYLFWLAVSDLGTMIFDSLFAFGYSRAPNNFIVALLQCHVVPGGAGILLTCSNFIVVVLTVDRFRAVLYPIETRAVRNRCHPGWKVSLCLVSAFVVFSPITYFWEVQAVTEDSDSAIMCYLCQRRNFSTKTLISYY